MGTQELVLIRGLPGSGKSTLAREMAAKGYTHLEADMWFESGGREFQPILLTHAHHWCKDETEKNLRAGRSVAVSNTFTRLWEMQDYVDMAGDLGVPVRVVTATGRYGGIRDIDPEKLAEMAARWDPLEDGPVTGELYAAPLLLPVR